MGAGPVALVSLQSDFFGGGEHSLCVLAEGLVANDVETRLVCPREGELSRAMRALGVGVAFCPMPSLRRAGLIEVPFALRTLRRAVAGASLVHINATRPMLLASLARLQKPLVFHVRNTGREPLLDPLLGSAADRIISISGAVARRFLPRGCGSKVRVIPNGVQLERFRGIARRDARNALSLPQRGRVFLSASRLHASKGHDYLIEAFSQIPDATLLLLGDGPERGVLERQARALGERVRFGGQQADVSLGMAAADVVVVPSLDEPFGRVAIEAMASGKPVVASRVGGLPEIVLHEKTGLLVSPGDVGAWVRSMQRVNEDGELRRRLARAGRRRAQTHFSAAAHASAVLDVYRELAPNAFPAGTQRRPSRAKRPAMAPDASQVPPCA